MNQAHGMKYRDYEELARQIGMYSPMSLTQHQIHVHLLVEIYLPADHICWFVECFAFVQESGKRKRNTVNGIGQTWFYISNVILRP